MRQPKLILRPPDHETTTEIVKCFNEGKPLTSEQINFLYWHSTQLSGATFDPILTYYLTPRTGKASSQTSRKKTNRDAVKLLKERIAALRQLSTQEESPSEEYQGPTFSPLSQCYQEICDHKKHEEEKESKELSPPPSFLLPDEKLNRAAIESLKNRLDVILPKNSKHSVEIPITEKKLLQFIKYTIQDLIFWHGNHFLTGDSFYPSGIPPLIHFQWGNCFGIVKYHVIGGEKALMGNYLLYFEDMAERSLEQCIADYEKHKKEELRAQNKNTLTHSDNKEIIKPSPQKPVSTPQIS